MSLSNSVKVAVRVRPLNKKELDAKSHIIVSMKDQTTTLEAVKLNSDKESRVVERSRMKHKQFVYDYSYWSTSTHDSHYVSQEQVFKDLGTMVLDAAFEGYNACVFAYGQTGAGKTYTMMGEKHDPGLIPRICKGLYGQVSNNSNQQESFRVEVSYLEIYNEQVFDLLRPDNNKKQSVTKLRVREHPKNGPYVQGLTRNDAPDIETLESLMNQGNHLRTTAATNMNEQSSRSHAIFSITFTQAKFVTGLPSEVTSKINLVDLAGSERVAKSGATGERLKEGGNINRSLTTLGQVISALAEKSSRVNKAKPVFIPYRDSVLTWLLKDSLGGNSKTIMIAAISPSDSSHGETLSTLRYADRAKSIVNAPTVNEDQNVKLIRELKAEIERLKAIIDKDKIEVVSRNDDVIEEFDHTQKLLEGTEIRMEKHLRAWADKWKDALHIIEESDLGFEKKGSALRIDMDPPHLVLLDNDPLNTSITIFSLKEGKNYIGNPSATREQDMVFDGDEIQNEHCMLTYDTTTVVLTPTNGNCYVNTTPVKEPKKLSQGDIIVLGKNTRLKFNFPFEATALREKRRSAHYTNSLELCSASTPEDTRESRRSQHLLSPLALTDESGVEIDFSDTQDDGDQGNIVNEEINGEINEIDDISLKLDDLNETEDDKKEVDNLRDQVEDLLTKYKESEIERFESDVTNQLALQEKEKEIEKQRKEMIELQRKDGILLQRYQDELGKLREELSEKRNVVRVQLEQKINELFDDVIPQSREMTELSMKELEQYREEMSERLHKEWEKLDEHELNLIEVEAEKQSVINEAEIRLQKERVKGEVDKMERLSEIEKEKKTIQDILENHIQEREICRKAHRAKEKEFIKCKRKLEKGIEDLVGYVGELESEQCKLSNMDDKEVIDEKEAYEITQTIDNLEQTIQEQQKENEQKMDQLTVIQNELLKKDHELSSCDKEVEEGMRKFEEVRRQYSDCQQQFGEELGQLVHVVHKERDDDVRRIEEEKESLINQLLEHQIALETLVHGGFQLIGDKNQERGKELREKIEDLLKCASSGLEHSSLESKIIEKTVEIHQRQVDLQEKEQERILLHDVKEREFCVQRQVMQHEREHEQHELMAKIKSLEELMRTHGEHSEECAAYFELESSSLLRAQKYILQLDKELRDKLKEKQHIDKQLERLNSQVNLQAESSQEQFRDSLEDLRQRSRETDDQLSEIKQKFQKEADHYLMRLRRESFVVLEKTIVTSYHAKVASGAVNELLREVEFASRVPELSGLYEKDCNGWRYEMREKNVDILRKDTKNINIHCFMGRGIIKAPPSSISKTVSNPLSRFVYDKMLKNIRIIENVAEELKIVHMVHETSHCFIKHSRDFCFVAYDKEKKGKYILACQSVEHQNCPDVKGVVRAQILSSGWVIEPITINEKPCSLVWHLTQVNLGGSIPTRLVNYVAKRQPLSVAYLRDYLTPEH